MKGRKEEMELSGREQTRKEAEGMCMAWEGYRSEKGCREGRKREW